MKIYSINAYSNKRFPNFAKRKKRPEDYFYEKQRKDQSVGIYAGDVELNKISEKYQMKFSNIKKEIEKYGVSFDELDDLKCIEIVTEVEMDWTKFPLEVKRLYEKYLKTQDMYDLEGRMAFYRSDSHRDTSWEKERQNPYRNRPMLALPPPVEIT